MIHHWLRRRPWLLAIPGAAVVLFGAISMTPGTTSGQAAPTATAAAAALTGAGAALTGAGAAAPAPALDSDVAVRMLLPASIRDSERLPVRKYGRADLPDAPGGYIVFIATIYPIYDGQGGSTEWLLTNYLQWNGFQWLPAIADYPGVQLTKPDDIWLARNLTDITALAPPPAQAWKVFTVGYTAGPGDVTATLSRTETVAEIYDLTDSTVWSRTISLRETDTGNSGYVLNHAEDVDWSYQDVDGDGVFDLITTVKDTDEVILTGDAASPGTQIPDAGVYSSTTSEFWKYIDGVFVLQTRLPAAAAPATTSAAPAATAPAAAAGAMPPLVPVVTVSPLPPAPTVIATAPAAAATPTAAATAAPPRLIATAPSGPAPSATATSTTILIPARTASPAASPTPSPATPSPTVSAGPAG